MKNGTELSRVGPSCAECADDLGLRQVLSLIQMKSDEAPFSDSGFKTEPSQIAWSSFENAGFAKFGRDLAVIWLRASFETGVAERALRVMVPV